MEIGSIDNRKQSLPTYSVDGITLYGYREVRRYLARKGVAVVGPRGTLDREETHAAECDLDDDCNCSADPR